MSHKDIVEKRSHPRIVHSVPLKICSGAADFVTETRNISSSGAYCRVDKYLEPMTKLKITLLLPVKKAGKTLTKKIVCTGVVVRTENAPFKDFFNLAIFFSDISSNDSRALTDYVRGVLTEKTTG